MFDSSKIQPHIAFTDLREWMREAEALGELKSVLGASWQEDIGLASDVVVPLDDGPAVIFDEVPGCPKGFRLLVNVFAGKRRAMTLGFPQGLTKQELSQAYFEHYQKKQRHIPPVIVDSGSVFENVVTGADVDIEKFPTPIWHVNDGGRYRFGFAYGDAGRSDTFQPPPRALINNTAAVKRLPMMVMAALSLVSAAV